MKPAFPNSGGRYEEYLGMTLLDYFAAHAPKEPTWYFQPEMPTPRPTPLYDTDPASGFERVPTNAKAINEWDDERSKQREIQWPYIWAAAMLAERERRMK